MLHVLTNRALSTEKCELPRLRIGVLRIGTASAAATASRWGAAAATAATTAALALYGPADADDAAREIVGQRLVFGALGGQRVPDGPVSFVAFIRQDHAAV